MSCQKGVFCLAAVTVILLTSQSGETQEGYSIEISTAQKRTEYGSPIVLSLRLVYQQPQMWRVTGKTRQVVSLDLLDLQVQQSETEETRLFRLWKTVFHLQGTKGLEYTGKVVLWCHVHEERGKLIKRMIFDKPGAYTFSVMDAKKRSSNTLDILMEPSDLGQKALSLLTDPKDIAFLIGGVYKSPESVSRLEEVVNQCEGILLAKWAASRLGIEYFKEFQKKHPSFEKFKALRDKGKLKEPLFDQVRKYLSAGAELPDEFSVRENVVFKLFNMEFLDGNYEKAFSLLDELRTKYPDGEYGRKASGLKEKLIELQKRELAQAPRPRVNGWSRLLPLFLVIAAGIVLIGLILVLKKKASSRGKSRAT